MEIVDTFQNRLKTAMNIRNIKQVELVEKTKLDKTLINKYLSGVSNAKQKKLTILAEALNINEVWLMGYDVPMERNAFEEKKASQFYMCPVYGQISAGQPNWAEECLNGYLPIDPNLMGIINPEECFFLKINGESMNKVIRNGAYALIRKQDSVEDGEIAVVLVNGFDATLKKFTKQGDFVFLEPMSTDETIKRQIYDKNTPIKIIGKYIGKFEIN